VKQRLRILSLSTVFPRPPEPNFGVFVARRLEALGRRLAVQVAAPVPWVEGSGRRLLLPARGVPRREQRGGLVVHHPRWLYPPGLGAAHAWCLAASLAPFLASLRAEFDFDLIDAHFGYPEGAAALRLARRFARPFTVTLRGNEPAHAASPAKRRQMAEALQQAAAVIAVSRALCDFAISLGAPPARCAVIGNGVDTAVFYPRPRQESRARLGMQEGRIHLLSAGYLIPRKGHHRLAALLPALHAAGIPADLWIVGGPGREGDARPELERIIGQHGLGSCVHRVGPATPEQLAGYMSACDLFCLASSREGWPNVVHEAMACGAPVVATRVGAVEDMVPGPEFGRIVPPDDPQALLAALIEASRARFDRERIARHAASRSWDRVAQETADLFESILESSVSGSPG
jgi:teichuronic acid biosynthesis glycosyltransferase TuaC